jgi:hypothetical protein
LALALALLVTGPAPGASAGFEFEAGSYFAKAHAPLTQDPPLVFDNFQGSFTQGQGGQEAEWVQEILDAPPLTQAGAHPDLSVSFKLSVQPSGDSLRDGHPRTISIDLPAGSIENPRAVPRCRAADFHLTTLGACPPASQVGESITHAVDLALLSPVSSLEPYPGASGLLGFKALSSTALFTPSVRGGDYGLRVTIDDVPVSGPDFTGSTLTLWGVPHDPVHDPHRVNALGGLGGLVSGTPKPFLAAPTDCRSGPLRLTTRVRSWERPDNWIEATATAPEPTGCEQIEFEPSLSGRVTTVVADSPTGFDLDLHMRQGESCEPISPPPPRGERQYDCTLSTSHLREAEIALPEGVAINPAGANGLDGCSSSEVGLATPLGSTPIQFDVEPVRCPDASRVGSVEIDTPLLETPLQGSIFLADPYDNPFESRFALYLAVDDVRSGIVTTMAGKVEADPETGQLSAVVGDSPQLPVERYRLHLKQGRHAPLRTPPGCGTYSTTSELTPYSDPGSSFATRNEWSISAAPSGTCVNDPAELPISPAFEAGAVSPIAGIPSPFVLHLRRPDGTQTFKALAVSLPPGLIVSLRGVARCPEAALASAAGKSGAEERATRSCPDSSQVGSLVVGVGAGPSPYYAPGRVYLAGPYKDAPLSLASVVPAKAGPFDFGTVVVRSAVHIDPSTARIAAVSDPLPEILGGVPLDVRTLGLSLDRDRFTRTGTSCRPGSVEGRLTSNTGQVTQLPSRFQLADCRQLPFKPRLSIVASGAVARNGHPVLRAELDPRPADAGVAEAAFTLPAGQLLDIRHIGAICSRHLPVDQCPRGSRLGWARLWTPLLSGPFDGPIYLRSQGHRLPALIADLRHEQVRFLLRGQIAAPRGRLRVSFPNLPDVPLSKARLNFAGGYRGVFVNTEALCGRPRRGGVDLTAHNGKQRFFRSRLVVRGRC